MSPRLLPLGTGTAGMGSICFSLRMGLLPPGQDKKTETDKRPSVQAWEGARGTGQAPGEQHTRSPGGAWQWEGLLPPLPQAVPVQGPQAALKGPMSHSRVNPRGYLASAAQTQGQGTRPATTGGSRQVLGCLVSPAGLRASTSRANLPSPTQHNFRWFSECPRRSKFSP